MVSKRTAVGRASKSEGENGSERHRGQRGKEKEGHSTREKKNAMGGAEEVGVGCVQEGVRRENKRRERLARESWARRHRKGESDSLNFQDQQD